MTKRIYQLEKKCNPDLETSFSIPHENHRIDDEIASQAHRAIIPKTLRHVKWKPGSGYYGKIWPIMLDSPHSYGSFFFMKKTIRNKKIWVFFYVLYCNAKLCK